MFDEADRDDMGGEGMVEESSACWRLEPYPVTDNEKWKHTAIDTPKRVRMSDTSY